jgi:hypothetical protein
MRQERTTKRLLSLCAAAAIVGLCATVTSQSPSRAQPTSTPYPSAPGMAGMDMSASSSKLDSVDNGMSMKPLKMPQLPEIGTYMVTGHEDWKVRTGFGKNTPMVGMMSRMMVGASGMEGMKMGAMKMNFGPQNYTEDPDDETSSANTGERPMNGNPAPGMQMDSSAQVAPVPVRPVPVTQQTSGGTAVAPISVMPGMNMTASPPTTVTSTPKKTGRLKITGVISHPSNGDNVLTITISDTDGSPVTGAKIISTVVMTSMDMGTTHPQVKELGNGKYRTTVNFGMSGPWRVSLTVTPLAGSPQKTSFDFNAK